IQDGGTAKVALTVDGGNQTLTLSGANTYSGATTINTTDTLQVGAADATTANYNNTDNGTLDLGGFDTTINGLSGNGSVLNSAAGTGTNTLTVDGGGSFAGTIHDGATAKVALTVAGANQTLTLSGSNTYSGATTINATDTLQVGA